MSQSSENKQDEKYDAPPVYVDQFIQAEKGYALTWKDYVIEVNQLELLKKERQQKIEKMNQEIKEQVTKVQDIERFLAAQSLNVRRSWDIQEEYKIQSLTKDVSRININMTPGGPYEYESDLTAKTKHLHRLRTQKHDSGIIQRRIERPIKYSPDSDYTYKYGIVCYKIYIRI